MQEMRNATLIDLWLIKMF